MTKQEAIRQLAYERSIWKKKAFWEKDYLKKSMYYAKVNSYSYALSIVEKITESESK